MTEAERKRNAELLVEIRKRFDYASNELREIRDEARTDMRYVAGDPWEEEDKAKRKAAGRPYIALDELGQYMNQVVNGVRAAPLSIKFSPNGGGANEDSAEFYEHKTREIEYRSKAQIAYITALENALNRSYGFVKITTKYVHDDLEQPNWGDQDIWIEPNVNPDMITPDPDSQMPNGSDMEYCFEHEWVDEDDFKAEHPNATITDFTADVRLVAPNWFRDTGNTKRVLRAKYWVRERQPKRVRLLLKPPPEQRPPQPIAVWEDELKHKPKDSEVLRRREVDSRKVVCYLTNGVEILKTTPWPGKYIPIIPCYGKVLWLDQGAGVKRVILSMTRLARNPYMAYCYARSCEMEILGGVPRNSFIGYEGQFANPDEWKKAHHEPVAYLEAKATTEATGNQILPLPQHQPWDPPLHNIELVCEAMRRTIQAAMGIAPLPTEAQRVNQKSGRALQKIEQSSQRGSFHFIDHYNDMIEHVGVCIEDLLDKVIDNERQTGIRLPNDTGQMVPVNRQGAVSTKGNHLVTVGTGPNYDSEHEEASDFADTLAQIPAVFARIGDLIVKLKHLGPIGDEIADRLTPPEYRKVKDGQMDPQQMAQGLQQAMAQVKQLEGVAGQMKQALETEQAKQRATVAKAAIDAKTQILLQKMKDATSIAVAEIAARAKGVVSANEAEVQAIALQHEATENELARAHDVEMAAVEHQHALDEAAQGHAHAMSESDQAHAQDLETGEADHAHALEQGDQAGAQAMEQQTAAAAQSEAGA